MLSSVVFMTSWHDTLLLKLQYFSASFPSSRKHPKSLILLTKLYKKVDPPGSCSSSFFMTPIMFTASWSQS